jgi:hypothetical protein
VGVGKFILVSGSNEGERQLGIGRGGHDDNDEECLVPFHFYGDGRRRWRSKIFSSEIEKKCKCGIRASGFQNRGGLGAADAESAPESGAGRSASDASEISVDSESSRC